MANAKTKFGINEGKSYTSLLITSSGTLTKPSDVDMIYVMACGGGGGARAYGSSSPYNGAGGGGGAALVGWLPWAADLNVTIGAAGANGSVSMGSHGGNTDLDDGNFIQFRLGGGGRAPNQWSGGSGGSPFTLTGVSYIDSSGNTLGGGGASNVGTPGSGNAISLGSFSLLGGGGGGSANIGNVSQASVGGPGVRGGRPTYSWSGRGYGGGGGSIGDGPAHGQTGGYGVGGHGWSGEPGAGACLVACLTGETLTFT